MNNKRNPCEDEDRPAGKKGLVFTRVSFTVIMLFRPSQEMFVFCPEIYRQKVPCHFRFVLIFSFNLLRYRFFDYREVSPYMCHVIYYGTDLY